MVVNTTFTTQIEEEKTWAKVREKERERDTENRLLAATQRALLDKSFEETRHKYI